MLRKMLPSGRISSVWKVVFSFSFSFSGATVFSAFSVGSFLDSFLLFEHDGVIVTRSAATETPSVIARVRYL